MNKHLFCFGLGYTATYLIKILEDMYPNKWIFGGSKRNIKQISSRNTKIFEFNSDLILPTDITHLLISIPPDNTGDIVNNIFLGQILSLKKLEWIGYLSATSVYGNHNGNWVDETATTAPTYNRGILRVNAENKWLNLFTTYNLPIHIFRLAGIYGIGRNVIEKILDKHNIPIIHKPGHYFSRIHVEDIVQILMQSMDKHTPGQIFNLADDLPCENSLVVEFAYKLLNLIPPKPVNLENTQHSEMTREFYSDNKRVSNNKIKETFNMELKYPNYKSGLENIMLAM